MAQFRFRPLETLEARETPAALWQTGIKNARANEGLVKQVSDYLVGTNQTTANPFAPAFINPATRDYLAKVVEQSQAGADKVRELRRAAIAKVRANPATFDQWSGYLKKMGGLEYQLRGIVFLARKVGAIVGTDFTPTTPTTPTGPTDAGMTNTRPNINSPNFVDQGNGLKIWDVKIGTGDVVAAGSNIKIFYTGWLTDAAATVFDSRRSPQAPIDFDLETLIQGWQQGIPGMREGGIRRLYIPADLAYGAAGRPNDDPPIPPNADLVFEIKVISTTP